MDFVFCVGGLLCLWQMPMGAGVLEQWGGYVAAKGIYFVRVALAWVAFAWVGG